MNSGVVSRLVRVHQLSELPFNTKVRFLGCIIKYDVDSGTLYVSEAQYEHQLGVPATVTSRRTVVGLDMSLHESSKSEQFPGGTWINIIGYIDKPQLKPVVKATESGNVIQQGIKIKPHLLWPAGPIDIEEYFEAVDTRIQNLQ